MTASEQFEHPAEIESSRNWNWDMERGLICRRIKTANRVLAKTLENLQVP
jgi:hypothetical protein